MADGEGGEKTEKGSGRQRDRAREKGSVPKSQEVSSAILLLVGMTLLVASGGHFVRVLGRNTGYLLGQAHILAPELLRGNVEVLVLAMGPLLGGALVAAFGGNVIQFGFRFTPAAMQFRPEKLNPLPGLKKFVQVTAFFELVKNLAKITVIGLLAYMTVKNAFSDLVALPLLSLPAVVATAKLTFVKLMAKLLFLMALIAIADWFFQKHRYEESIKMTKYEVKQENKDFEGDPQIKARIRGLQFEMARKRMLADVPRADVVITNPTHYAVAIRYEPGSAAPLVVAKGQDNLAQVIKKIARKHRVPVIENKPLARGLYRQVEVGRMIPESLFQAVAEVLAYVYRLKRA